MCGNRQTVAVAVKLSEEKPKNRGRARFQKDIFESNVKKQLMKLVVLQLQPLRTFIVCLIAIVSTKCHCQNHGKNVSILSHSHFPLHDLDDFKCMFKKKR